MKDLFQDLVLDPILHSLEELHRGTRFLFQESAIPTNSLGRLSTQGERIIKQLRIQSVHWKSVMT